MADVAIRRDGGVGQVAQPPAPVAQPDPWRTMRSLLRWDPFADLAPMWTHNEQQGSFMPAFELKETKQGFVLRADLPGVKENDVEINLQANRLTINGKRESEKREETDTYYVYERSSGSFTRSFTLPADVDDTKIHAELKNGVLTIDMAKKPEAQAKRIVLKSESKKS